MRPMFSLLRREFTAYFLSPIAYVVLTVFLLVTGHLFYLALNLLTESGHRGIEFPMQVLLGDEKFWLVFLFIPPLLTMRLFAEERATGTLEMLMTAPIRDWQVVLSKYLACFGFYVVLWIPTLVYLPILTDSTAVWTSAWTLWSVIMVLGLVLTLVTCVISVTPLADRVSTMPLFALGKGLFIVGALLHYTVDDQQLLRFVTAIDPMPVISSYVGVMLAGAMFLALGLFVSSLVRSQLVAAIVSLVLSLGFIVAGFWNPDIETGSLAYRLLYFFSVPLHFSREFTRGQIDTRHLVLYASVTLFCLFLTVRSLESRRWK